MQISNYSFEHLPFSQLFQTYVQDFPRLKEYYAGNPFNEQDISERANNLQFRGDRSESVAILTSFNERFSPDRAVFENLERLKEDNALALVTGQQLGVYGGPLYTIFKTISTIHLAKKLEQRYNQPVIPVFWLADEDHDYEEVRSLNILDRDDLTSFQLPGRENHLPVAEMKLPEEINQIHDKIRNILYETDFSDDLWELLDQCFQPGMTFLDAFGQFMSRLFSHHGLVLAGSNISEFKQKASEQFKESIAKAHKIRLKLEQQSSSINDAFHQQVTLYDSNLFYLDDEGGRMKISRNGENWRTNSSKQWETGQLIEEIETEPQKFSPNVFLRPVLQDVLLPTLGYVAGPSEIAYYGQMKEMYHCFGLEMPLIFPRMSATIVEPAIDRIIGELPFEFHEYEKRIEDLESEYVDRSEQVDIEAIFSEWKEKVSAVADPKKQQIAGVDPTLEGAAGKATAVYFGELDKLKGKLYRAVKQQDQTQLNRIHKIKAHLFPGDGLQERVISSIYFMNKYGLEIWDELLHALDKDEAFDQHKLIYV